MLSKTDLSDISNIISNSIQTQVPPLINHAIQTQVPPLVNNAIQAEVPILIQKELAPIKRSLQKLEKNMSYIINSLDNDLMSVTKRTDRIEKVLNIS